MPPCPTDRQCRWTIGGPHHDWWTTSAGALVLLATVLATLALIGWMAWLRHRANLYTHLDPEPQEAVTQRLRVPPTYDQER